MGAYVDTRRPWWFVRDCRTQFGREIVTSQHEVKVTVVMAYAVKTSHASAINDTIPSGFGNGRFGHTTQHRGALFERRCNLARLPKDYRFVNTG